LALFKYQLPMLIILFLTLAALSNPTDALLEAAAQGDTNKVDVLLQSQCH